MKIKPVKSKKSIYQYRGTKCLNCQHPLDISDKYCPQCAQKNSTKKVAVLDYIEEFFGSIISYDSKIAKTLYAMLFRPGSITRDYLDGKRIRYTNPFRFFLSINIVYFLLLGFSGKLPETNINFNKLNEEENLKALNEVLTKNSSLSDNEKKESKAIIEKLRTDIQRKQATKNYLLEIPYDSLSKIDSLQRKNVLLDYYSLVLKRDKNIDFDDAATKYHIPKTVYNKITFNLTKGTFKALENPNDVIQTLIARLPFVIFVFLPIFALFVWLFYATTFVHYTSHLIFCFHTQSLFTILLIFGALLDRVLNTNSILVILVLFCIYLYKALRNFYKQKRKLTLVKLLLLNTIFIILAFIISTITLAGSIALY